MAEVRSTPGAEKATKPLVEVAYNVRLSLATVPKAERRHVERRLRSHRELRKLSLTADRGGRDGTLYIADVSDELRAVFRFSDTGAEVVDLISKAAYAELLGA
jgi:hypothetical protein